MIKLMLNLVILFLLGLSCIAQSKPVTKSTIAIIKYDGKEIQTHNFIIAPNDLSNVYILSLAEIEKRSDAGMLKGKQVAILTLKENIPLLSLPELLYYSKLDSNSQHLRVNVDEKIADSHNLYVTTNAIVNVEVSTRDAAINIRTIFNGKGK